MTKKKSTQRDTIIPESHDREAPRIGIRDDGISYTNEENEWGKGAVGPSGKPARESERK
jgi:hypothetical protein